MTKVPFNGIKVLDDGFVGLVDSMGDDSAIVQAARISYGKDNRDENGHELYRKGDKDIPQSILDGNGDITLGLCKNCSRGEIELEEKCDQPSKSDTQLIRYLMRHRHTTPFEMVEFKFIIRIPMDAWRQMIRHRTASVNEYSTRYTEAIDSQQKTDPDKWRLQSKSNKQGSGDYLPASYLADNKGEVVSLTSDGQSLTSRERIFHEDAGALYQHRLESGVAKEQARKDLPLSTYTEAYWKIDLHNLFHFLSLRLDAHAQLEIRSYATAIYRLIKPVAPVACQAFEDYRLNGCNFSAQEMEVIREGMSSCEDNGAIILSCAAPEGLSGREWKELREKLETQCNKQY